MSKGEQGQRVWHNVPGAKAWSVPEFDAETTETPEEAAQRPPTAAELDALQKQAYEEAYAEGFQAGSKAGEDDMRKAIERLRVIAAELAAPLDELDRDLEYSLANLALVLARRIVTHVVQVDENALHALIKQAVATLGGEIEATVDIYLAPADQEFLNRTVGGEPNWRLHADPNLQSGDVRVERPPAEVDGRLQQRLERLAAEMLNG